MFEKAQIDALFGELDREWRGKPEFERSLGRLTWALPYGTCWPSIGENRLQGGSTHREAQA